MPKKREREDDEKFFGPSTRDKLEEMGIKTVHDDRLERRIQEASVIRQKLRTPLKAKDPEGQLLELEERLFSLDEYLRKTAIPWLRAGTETKFAKAVKSWEKLIRIAIEGINTMKSCISDTNGVAIPENSPLINYIKEAVNINDIKREDVTEILEAMKDRGQRYSRSTAFDQRELVRLIESYLEVEIFPYGFMISNIAFKSRDVSPSFSMVAPAQPPVFGYGTGTVQPTSAGRTSQTKLPSSKPFPPEMSSRIEEDDEEEETGQ